MPNSFFFDPSLCYKNGKGHSNIALGTVAVHEYVIPYERESYTFSLCRLVITAVTKYEFIAKTPSNLLASNPRYSVKSNHIHHNS